MRRSFSFIFVSILSACTTAPNGRQHLNLVDEERAVASANYIFTRAKRSLPIVNDPQQNSWVRCVLSALQPENDTQAWEVLIFKKEQANAFALQGGKIGINSGLLRATLNDAQLAFALAHEMNHVLSGHGREKLSQRRAIEALELVSQIAEKSNSSLSGIVDVGHLGLQFPLTKIQEREADEMALESMARAGFDPRQAPVFWQNMQAIGLNEIKTNFRSHPGIEERLKYLSDNMPRAVAIYTNAKEHRKCRSVD